MIKLRIRNEAGVVPRGWSLTVAPKPRLTTTRYRVGAAPSAGGHALQHFTQIVEAEGLPQHGPGGALQRVTGLGRVLLLIRRPPRPPPARPHHREPARRLS